LLTTLAISLVGAPGILEVYIPSTAALLLVMAVSTVTVFRDSAAVFWEQARRQIAGLLGIGLGQAWWLLPAVPALHSLYAQATTTGDSSLDSLRYASQFTSLEHVVTLTGVPQIYATYGDGRYISWGSTVTSMPGRVLIWVAPVVALIGVADLLRRRRSRLAGLAIAIGLLVGIFVAKGAHSPFGGFNLRLLSLPFGNVLRHPVDKISPLLVPLVTLLFALGLGTLSRARLARVSVLAAAVVPCLWLAVPWYSGSVMPQASGPLPSSWAEVPASYQQAGKVLSALPTGGKTMVLPFSVDGFAAFRWPSGVQPNLDCLFPSWAPTRSTLCEDSGFGPADRVGNMLSAATAADDYRTFALARIFGVDSWLVHKDWDTAYVSEGQNTAAASVAFLQDPTGVSSGTAQPSTYPLGPGQSVRLSVRVAGRAFGSAPLVAMGQARLQANEASDHHKIFFALNDPAHGLWLPGVSVSRRASHIVTVTRVRTGVEFSVDGVVQHGGYRIPPGSATGEADQLLPALTSIPDFQAFVAVPAPPPGIDVAVRSDAGRAGVSGPVPATAVDTNELAMWRQDALPLLYAPSSVGCTSAAASKDLASLAWRLRSDPAPVVVAQRDCDPAGTATVGWSRQSPTDYSGSLSVHGSGWLVFGQTYDKDWSLSLSSDHVRTVKHLMVNGYANAWQLSGDGTVRFSLRYGLQTPVTVGFIAAGVLFCACLVAGGVAARKVVSGKRGRS
ncbi:MAG: arabinofuranan 3-O-arabinosyltransferase, partial [Frankiaceae bacterium]|nr:arabinofuranan 3-O-arabinosyltransferase [Frankiaceae bacterium]